MNGLDIAATTSNNTILNPSLDQLGQALELDQSSLKHGYLNIYDGIFAQEDKETFVVIGNSELAFKEAKLFSQYYQNKRIFFLSSQFDDFENGNFIIHKYKNFNDLAFFIFSIDKIDVCIEHSDNFRKNKNHIFSTIFPFLKTNGLYFVEDIHSFYIDKFKDGDDSLLDFLNKIWESKYIKSENDTVKIYYPFYSQLVESYNNYGKLLAIKRSSVPVFKKIQRYFAKEVLKYNSNLLLNDEIKYKTQNIKSLANLKTNIDNYRDYLPKEIISPDISLRTYQNVLCLPGNLVFKDGFLLPEYQRRTGKPNHKNRFIKKESMFYVIDTFMKSLDKNNIPFLSGNYLYFDSEFDSQYGHIVIEQTAKLWAWDIFIKEHPDGKILVGAKSGRIHPLMLDILLKYGIPLDRIVPLTAATQVEYLYCPSQLYEITYLFRPEILNTWDFLKSKFLPEATLNDFPSKIFLTRSSIHLRSCSNQSVVENIFSKHGYQIIQPELLSFTDQVALFAHAEKIAGFAGSNTLNAIFSPNGITKTIIKSDSFTANNDYLISSVKRDNINICFCPSTQPRVFQSPFTFNIRKDRDFLEEVI